MGRASLQHVTIISPSRAKVNGNNTRNIVKRISHAGLSGEHLQTPFLAEFMGKEGVFFMDDARTTTYRPPATDEARERANAYRRDYARKNPERVKQWRLNYAQRLLERAQQNAVKGGGDE